MEKKAISPNTVILEVKTLKYELAVVVHSCNPSYLGDGGKRITGWKAKLAETVRLYLKNKMKNQKGWDVAFSFNI
jgi:hypothetical protein